MFTRSRRPDIKLGLSMRFMDHDFVSVHENAAKELGQYLAILTSRLVNNACECFHKVLTSALITQIYRQILLH